MIRRIVSLGILFSIGCSDFAKPMNYVLLVATGTSLRVFRFSPTARSLTEVSGSPISVGGTANWVALDTGGTTAFVAEGTTHKFKSFGVDPKTLALTTKNETSYVNQPGGICFASTGGAMVFANVGGASDEASGASATASGTLTIGAPFSVAGYRCARRTSQPGQVFYFYGQTDLLQVSSAGAINLLTTATVARDGVEVVGGNFMLGLDPSSSPEMQTFPAFPTSLTDTVVSSLAVTGATEVERIGSLYLVSTGAQNSVKTLRVSTAGTISLLATNSVTGTPSVMSADPDETYLAVNGGGTGLTTIYTVDATTGVLTAVASATTGIANHMALDLVGKRN